MEGALAADESERVVAASSVVLVRVKRKRSDAPAELLLLDTKRRRAAGGGGLEAALGALSFAPGSAPPPPAEAAPLRRARFRRVSALCGLESDAEARAAMHRHLRSAPQQTQPLLRHAPPRAAAHVATAARYEQVRAKRGGEPKRGFASPLASSQDPLASMYRLVDLVRTAPPEEAAAAAAAAAGRARRKAEAAEQQRLLCNYLPMVRVALLEAGVPHDADALCAGGGDAQGADTDAETTHEADAPMDDWVYDVYAEEAGHSGGGGDAADDESGAGAEGAHVVEVDDEELVFSHKLSSDEEAEEVSSEDEEIDYPDEASSGGPDPRTIGPSSDDDDDDNDGADIGEVRHVGGVARRKTGGGVPACRVGWGSDEDVDPYGGGGDGEEEYDTVAYDQREEEKREERARGEW